MNTTAPKRTVSKSYNAFKIRRRCRLQEVDASNVAHFATYSMTREGREICHHQHIDLGTLECRCDCENFAFKKAKFHPTVTDGDEYHCKHTLKAIGVARRNDMLPPVEETADKACIHCGVLEADSYFEICDANGHPIAGQFTCADCAHAATDDLSDAKPQTEPVAACYKCGDTLDTLDVMPYCYCCGDFR